MSGLAFRLSMTVAVVTTAVPTNAQPPASPAPAIWNLEWQESHCTISTGNSKTLGISLWMTPGDPDPEFYFVGSPQTLPSDVKTVTVALAPTGETFQAEAAMMSPSNPRVLRLFKLRHKFPPAFAKAEQVDLLAGDRRIAVPVHGAGKAMAALQQCIDDKLKEWGVDPMALAALRDPPTVIDSYSWVGPNDYPRDALDTNWSGRTVARLNVDATGKVTDCATVVSSGLKSVDEVTCRRALEKGKFNPAIGQDGHPIAAVRVVNVVFRIAQ